MIANIDKINSVCYDLHLQNRSYNFADIANYLEYIFKLYTATEKLFYTDLFSMKGEQHFVSKPIELILSIIILLLSFC